MQTENAPSLLCQGRGNFMKRHPPASVLICVHLRILPPGIVKV